MSIAYSQPREYSSSKSIQESKTGVFFVKIEYKWVDNLRKTCVEKSQ